MKKYLLALTILASQANLQAAGNPENGAQLFKTCIECHGENGQGLVDRQAPRIAGQFDWYIKSQLTAFKSKTRLNPEMYPFIKNLTQQDMDDLASYISKMK